MFKSIQPSKFSLTESPLKKGISNFAPGWVLFVLLLGLGLAVVAVYFVVIGGNWIMGLCLLLALPAFILINKYPWAVLLVWLLAIPFLTLTPTTPERQMYWIIHRALPPLTVIVMIFSSILHLYDRKFPKMGWPELASAGYITVSTLSIFLFDNAALSKFYLFYDRVISPVCIFLIIRWWPIGEKELKFVEPVIFFILLSQGVIGILSWFAPSLLPDVWLGYVGERATGTLRSYGAYAVTMIFTGLFLLQIALKRKTGWIRTLYILAFGLALFGLFLSFSRAAWVAGGLVLLGLFFLYPNFMVRFTILSTPVVLLVLASGPFTGLTAWARERLYSEEAQESAYSRLPVYQASIEMLFAKPVFGWGYEDFNKYDWQFYRRVGDFVNPDKDRSSHNFYLTLLSEQGLVGFFLFMIPFFWCLKRTLKTSRKLPSGEKRDWRLLAVLWLFILAYIIVNFFQSMRIVFGFGLWWITLALIANIVEGHVKTDELTQPVVQPLRKYRLRDRLGRDEAVR